ncbi:GNAT family N-acetyltransferase [Neobacillus mesonae]|nr:GNAT family N-acetyltransferase [Neobacillus mesonae]
MESLEIVSMSKLTEQQILQAAEVYVNSYYSELSSLSKDETVLTKIIKSSFIEKQFYAAVMDHQIVGIMAYSTSSSRSQHFEKDALKRVLGTTQGSVVHYFLANQFHKKLPLNENECFLEAVATDPKYRGRGIATSMLLHLIQQLPFNVFKLEVVDTNRAARSIYEKQGFRVYKTVKQRLFRKRLGFKEKLYMMKTVDKSIL